MLFQSKTRENPHRLWGLKFPLRPKGEEKESEGILPRSGGDDPRVGNSISKKSRAGASVGPALAGRTLPQLEAKMKSADTMNLTVSCVSAIPPGAL